MSGCRRNELPALPCGRADIRGGEADSEFGEGLRRREFISSSWLPLPENRRRFAPAICRPSRKGRAGVEFTATQSYYRRGWRKDVPDEPRRGCPADRA